jgi:hypothetical protein
MNGMLEGDNDSSVELCILLLEIVEVKGSLWDVR